MISLKNGYQYERSFVREKIKLALGKLVRNTNYAHYYLPGIADNNNDKSVIERWSNRDWPFKKRKAAWIYLR